MHDKACRNNILAATGKNDTITRAMRQVYLGEGGNVEECRRRQGTRQRVDGSALAAHKWKSSLVPGCITNLQAMSPMSGGCRSITSCPPSIASHHDEEQPQDIVFRFAVFVLARELIASVLSPSSNRCTSILVVASHRWL